MAADINTTLRNRLAAYGGSTPADLVDHHAREVRAVEKRIANAKQRLNGHAWPDVTAELSYLQGTLKELRERSRMHAQRAHARQTLLDRSA
jgi:hypothetical protein